jgi:hypothetical protein
MSNNDEGIWIYKNQKINFLLIMKFNRFIDNKLAINATEAKLVINAEYNYWGTIDEAKIKKMIKGNVDYDPWLDDERNVYTGEDSKDGPEGKPPKIFIPTSSP